jgi:hypothetical protein
VLCACRYLLKVLVGVAGFEPATPSSRTKAGSARFDALPTVYDPGCVKLPKLQSREKCFLGSFEICLAQRLSLP